MTTSYIMIRTLGLNNQMYAGMFDSEVPNFQKLLDEARADPGLTVVRLEHEGSLLACSWAEIEATDGL